MIDWQVKSLSKHSEFSGRKFQSGQRIVSFLFKNEEGDLGRADVLDEEREDFRPPGAVLGWWGRRLRKDLDESEANREAVASTEEFFLSLYDDRAGDIEESAVLKYLFAIMLERKRILKPVGRAMPGEPQTYLMRKSGRKFDVPIVDVTAQSVMRIEEQLKACL